MSVHLNREIKAYCPDFAPVRQLLLDRGAIFIEDKGTGRLLLPPARAWGGRGHAEA